MGNKAPYELINEEDEDMWALFDLLKMDLIPPDARPVRKEQVNIDFECRW